MHLLLDLFRQVVEVDEDVFPPDAGEAGAVRRLLRPVQQGGVPAELPGGRERRGNERVHWLQNVCM